jgi:hypothetical protein
MSHIKKLNDIFKYCISKDKETKELGLTMIKPYIKTYFLTISILALREKIVFSEISKEYHEECIQRYGNINPSLDTIHSSLNHSDKIEVRQFELFLKEWLNDSFKNFNMQIKDIKIKSI